MNSISVQDSINDLGSLFTHAVIWAKGNHKR